MNIGNQHPCMCCKAKSQTNSANHSIENIKRNLDSILKVNSITKRELLSYRNTRCRLVSHYSSYATTVNRYCGHCTDSGVNLFHRKEEEVIEEVCLFLKYYESNANEMNNCNLRDLKNACRGIYRNLYATIDRLERHIERQNVNSQLP